MERLVSKISGLKQRVESLLDSQEFDLNHKEKMNAKQIFEVRKDLALIRGLAAGLPDDHVDRMIVLFTRMAMFFDAGVMVENQDGFWAARAFFERGIVEPVKTDSIKKITLPHVELLKVLKTSSSSVLGKLDLKHLDPDNACQCLYIKVSMDFSFLLFSKLPDLWLKEHMENILSALQSGIAD